MKGMEYLMDRPACEYPELVKMYRHSRHATREHHQGRTKAKRDNNRRSSSDKTGQATRQRQRDLILKRWGPVCHICWDRGITDNRAVIDLSLPWPDSRCFTRDHVIPRSKGGTDSLDNLKPAHHQCNRDRGNGPVIFDQEDLDALEMAA
jgi:5-methylcytosine-specific restriction endonuclease McrA